MALNVANWNDKQLDELTDLLRSADFSEVASFMAQNFLCSGTRIMDDDTQTTMRVSVGTNVTTVNLSAGVFQHNGKIGHIDTTQVINILNPLGPGNWGPGLAADPGSARWSIISVKQAEQYNTVENRWFVDDTVIPNVYSQRLANTKINKAYFNIVVTHGSGGGGVPATPLGYFTICEIYIPATCVDLSLATIYDTTDNPPFYTSANWNAATRVKRLEFWSTLFNVDHDPATGHHREHTGVPGTGFHIGATEVTSTANEINRLHTVGATVTAPNLTQLTDGSSTTLHSHTSISAELRAENGYTTLPSGLIMQWGYGTWGTAENSQTVNFPISFPTICLTVTVTTEEQSASASCNSWFQLVNGTITTTGFNCFRQREEAAPTINSRPRYIAIGY